MNRQVEKHRVDGKCLQTQLRFTCVMLPLLLIVTGTSFAQMKPGDVRKAYGDTRASVIESVLTTLYPGAQVQWDPQLALQLGGEKPRMVQVPVYVRGGVGSGGLEGIATVELEGRKEQFIYEAQNFRRTDRPVFTTELVVFRADMAGHIQKYRRLVLEPDEPVTEVKIMSIKDWSQREWPVLEIRYDTHRAAPGSFTTIEWNGALDANSGQFISRLPLGISRKLRGGGEQLFAFGITRSGPTTVLITNRFGEEAHPYNCSDRCVMEADRLLSEWKLNDSPATTTANRGSANSAAAAGAENTDTASPATIQLKNGRTIHADNANEAGDKIEYSIGESVFRIPKSLVQEIAHSNTPPSASQNVDPRTELSPQSPARQSDCAPNPHIGCPVNFFVQVLMGLGETSASRCLIMRAAISQPRRTGQSSTLGLKWTSP